AERVMASRAPPNAPESGAFPLYPVRNIPHGVLLLSGVQPPQHRRTSPARVRGWSLRPPESPGCGTLRPPARVGPLSTTRGSPDSDRRSERSPPCENAVVLQFARPAPTSRLTR